MLIILDKEKQKEILINNWNKKHLEVIQSEIGTELYTLLALAYSLGLHKQLTDNVTKGRRWTSEEDQFLRDYSDVLNTKEAANLLHRTRYATYQRVKLLHLDNMINKNG